MGRWQLVKPQHCKRFKQSLISIPDTQNIPKHMQPGSSDRVTGSGSSTTSHVISEHVSAKSRCGRGFPCGGFESLGPPAKNSIAGLLVIATTPTLRAISPTATSSSACHRPVTDASLRIDPGLLLCDEVAPRLVWLRCPRTLRPGPPAVHGTF